MKIKIRKSYETNSSSSHSLTIGENKTKEDLMKYINTISFENEKIASISSFVTKANFNLRATEIEMDMVQFIEDYIQNIYSNQQEM